MHKEAQRCSPKETAILSKHYLSQHDSLFSLVIALGFKTKKQVWGNVEDSGDMFILLSTHSSVVQCRSLLLSFSLVSLSPRHRLQCKVSDSVLSCWRGDLHRVTGSAPPHSIRATLGSFSRAAQRLQPCFLQL